jgi:hypothetical protein
MRRSAASARTMARMIQPHGVDEEEVATVVVVVGGCVVVVVA